MSLQPNEEEERVDCNGQKWTRNERKWVRCFNRVFYAIRNLYWFLGAVLMLIVWYLLA